MATYEINLSDDILPDLLSSTSGLHKLVEAVLNQILDAQMTEHLQARPFERTAKRQAYRNGYRSRKLITRVGPLELRLPQARDGSFSTDLFVRYQRSEQALVLAMMEMVVNGVSTRKVTAITEELCGQSFSKSAVSQLAQGLDERVQAWNQRDLSGQPFPFVIVDALVFKVRRDEAVRSTSGLIAIGINAEGVREILGLQLGDSESEATWTEMFSWLKERGLHGVELLVSDAHKGLVKAAQRQFQGVMWQRCQFHLLGNVLALAPNGLRRQIAEGMKRIYGAGDKAQARQRFVELVASLNGKAERAMQVLEEGLEEALAVLVLPEKYRVRLRTTNMAERLNEEIRRRERVIRIFPNEESALRLVGAMLIEQHEQWSTGKKYLDMGEYWEWRGAQARDNSASQS